MYIVHLYCNESTLLYIYALNLERAYYIAVLYNLIDVHEKSLSYGYYDHFAQNVLLYGPLAIKMFIFNRPFLSTIKTFTVKAFSH